MKYHFVDGPWAGVVVTADYMPGTVILRGSAPDVPMPGGGQMMASGDIEHLYTLQAAASDRADVAYFQYQKAAEV